jgi:hypothetical protein
MILNDVSVFITSINKNKKKKSPNKNEDHIVEEQNM